MKMRKCINGHPTHRNTSTCPHCDAPILGRPPINGDPMRHVSLYLTDQQAEWLKTQSGGMAATIRRLVNAEMSKAP